MSDREVINRSRLTLEKRHQLIDLNKEYVNFDITFECKSVDATKDFEIIVVNQEQLNTVDLSNLTMKKTNGGYLSGNIIADEDKYQNYFLILRSATEEPVDVDLEIKIRPIEPRPHGQMPSPPSHDVSMPLLGEDDITHPCPVSSPMGQSRVFFIVLGLIVIGGAIGYYFWKNSKKTTTNVSTLEDDVRSVYSEKSSSSAGSHSSSSTDEKGILDTLIQKSKTT